MNKAALLIIDVQNGMFQPANPVYHGEVLLSKIITPDPDDMIVYKNTPDAFFQTDLQKLLQQQNIHTLLLTGIQTEACMDTTCRRAFSLGYQVTLAADTHSTWAAGELSAQQIINHHNRTLIWFADVVPSDTLAFKNGALR